MNSRPPLIAPWPAAPADNATIVLFATHERAAGGSGDNYPAMGRLVGCSSIEIEGIEVVFHRHNKASAANGIRVYARDDTGTWRESDLKDDVGAATIGAAAPRQVGALAAGQEARLFFDVGRFPNGFALEYTAGADNPEEWNGTIALHIRRGAILR